MGIYSLSTPLGGAICIIRISGEGTLAALNRIFKGRGETVPNMLRVGLIMDGEEMIDEAMAVYFKAPYSYTGEDMAELHCHGSAVVVDRVMGLLSATGLRLAQCGEFTKRAFLKGKMDLTQSEAVMSLISSNSERGRKASLMQLRGSLSQRIKHVRDGIADILAHIEVSIDYPEEDLDRPNMAGQIEKQLLEVDALLKTFKSGRLLFDGIKVAIAGRPNVGKSSLLNAIAGEDRAIVTDIPGTTRDTLEVLVKARGLVIKLYDTAGIRRSDDAVEALGVERSIQMIEDADVILMVLDTSEPLAAEDYEVALHIQDKPVLIALNKSDAKSVLTQKQVESEFNAEVLPVSAATGEGLDALISKIYDMSVGKEGISDIAINARHREAILFARQHLQDALDAAQLASEDCLSIDIRSAWEALGEVIGETTTEDLLDRIFSQFCLGK